MTAKETNQLKEVQMEAAIPCKEEMDELVVEMSIQSNDLLNNCPNHTNPLYPNLTFA